MAEDLPKPPTNDTLSSISLFIGIPTQEHRSVQGHLAGLIGNVMRIAHKCHEGRQELDKYTYTPLIEGASAYISVFGHFVSKKDDWSREDDHSEVVEFFTSPEEYYATLLLVLCEIAYPALVLANQKAILMLLRHRGSNDRVMLWREGDITPSARPGKGMSGSDYNVDDHALQSLSYLLSTLVNSELSDNDRHEASLPDWLRLNPENAGPLFKGLPDGWKEWLRAHDNDLQYEVTNETDYYLPTIRIRILLDLTCWWLFYAASQTIKETIQEADNDLWAGITGRVISNLLQRELDRLEIAYFSSEDREVKKREFSFESDDPLPNAILWLAFVHDFVAHSLNTSAHIEATTESRTDPLVGANEEELTDASMKTPAPALSLKFDEYVDKILPAYIKRPKKEDVTLISYWRSRLDLLEKLNDRYFPDHHLLSAWRLLFQLIGSPRISLDTSPDIRSDLGYSVKWAPWLSSKRESQGPDMWVRLNRSIRESPAITRLWTAPLTIEAVFAFTTLGVNKAKKWNFGTSPSLKKRLEALYSDRKHGLTIIEKVARDATLGYPLKLTEPTANTTPLTKFVYYMQSDWQSDTLKTRKRPSSRF